MVSRVFAVFVIAVSAACSQADSDGERAVVASPTFYVEADGERYSGPPARVYVRFRDASAPEVELVFVADMNGTNLSVFVNAEPSFLDERVADVRIAGTASTPGTASVTLVTNDSAQIGSSGRVVPSVGARKLTGELVVSNLQLSATFDGPFALSCAVPPSALAVDDAPVPNDGGASVLIDDTDFVSALCRPYKDWGEM